MNINARDPTLTLVESHEPKGQPRKGDRSSERYGADGVDVPIKYVLTEVCAPDDGSSGRRVLVARGRCGS